MGGKTSTSTSQVSIPPEVLARYNSVNTQAQQAAAAPFQIYSTNPNAFVAPVNAQQYAGINTINNAGSMIDPLYGTATGAVQSGFANAMPQLQAAGQTAAAGYAGAQPYLTGATGFALAGGQAVDPSQLDANAIGQYMNPYLGTVLGSTEALINQQNQQQQAGQMGNAISSGAFGGDRSGIAAAVLAGQQQLAAGQTYSGILSDAYNQALSTAQQQQGVNLAAAQANRAALQQTGQSLAALGAQGFGQAQTEAQTQAALAQQGFGMSQADAQTLANLAQGWQGAYLQEGQAQLGAGQVEQQTQQAGLTALYNQFLQQQSYPFQTAQFLANIAEGTGALSGSTTTGTQPGGLFMSDERVKEDMQPVGKGFDGANIYRFRYKGDPTWRMGLSAQETERRHPEAVAELPSGFKAVEYGRATQEAAERGGFANAANDNAAWEPERRARQAGGYQGFGGVQYPSGVNQFDLAQMLNAQEGMYGPFTQSGLYGGSASGAPHGGSSYVPQANVPIAHLAPAELPKPRQGYDPIHQAAQDASDARDFWQRGKSLVQGAQKTLAAHADAQAARAASSPATQAAWHDLPTTYGQDSSAAAQAASSAGQDAAATVSDAASSAQNAADVVTDPSTLASIGSAAGGFIGARRRRRRAEGGFGDTSDDTPDPSSPPEGTAPYHPQGAGLDIPDTPSSVQPLKGPDLPKQQESGFLQFMNDAAQIAKTAGQFAGGARRGGRIGYATGGDPTDDLISDLETADNNSDLGALLRQTLTPPPPQRRRPAGFANAVAPESPAGAPAAPSAGLAAAARPSEAPGPAPAPAGFAGTMRAEGTGLNPLSGANGPGQFLPRTFLGEFKKVFPDRAANMSDAQILALHGTPEGNALQAQMIPHLRADNAATLQAQNIPVTPATEHVMWILGPHEGPRVLQADPATPMENLVRPIAIRENPHIMAGKTAGQFVSWADRSIRARGGAVRRGFALAGGVGSDDPSIAQDQSGADVDTSMGIRPDDTPPPSRPTRTADDTAGFGAAAVPPAAAAPPPELPAGGTDPYLEAAQARQEIEQSKYDKLVDAQNQKPRNFWGWLTQPEHLLPLVQGLGAAAAAPTSHPLTALLVGGAAGAQSYQQQRAYDMANAREAAETAVVGTGAQATAAGVPIQAYQARTDRLNVAGQAYLRAIDAINQWLPRVTLPNGDPGIRDTMSGVDYDMQTGTNLRKAALMRAQQAYSVAAGGGDFQNPVIAAIGPNGQQPSTVLPPGTASPRPGTPSDVAAQPSTPARTGPVSPDLGLHGDRGTAGDVATGLAGRGTGNPSLAPPPSLPQHAVAHKPLPATAALKDKVANGEYMDSNVPLVTVDTSQLKDVDNPDRLHDAAIANRYAGDNATAETQLQRRADILAGKGALPQRKDGTQEDGYYKNAQAQVNYTAQQEANQALINKRNIDASHFYGATGQYATLSPILDDLVKINNATDVEGMEPVWADLTAKARGTALAGFISAHDKEMQHAFQTEDKDAARQIFAGAAGPLGAEIMHAAPAAGMHGSAAAIASPSKDPGTKFNIIVHQRAALEQQKKQYDDWIANSDKVTAGGLNRYDKDWEQENDPKDFVQRAADTTPYFAGMTLKNKEEYPRHPTSFAQVQRYPKPAAENSDDATPFIIPDGRWKGHMAVTTPTGFRRVN